MKRTLTLIALLALALASCKKAAESDRTPAPGEIVSMDIILVPETDNQDTKAGNNTEAVINESQIIIFDASGAAEAYARTVGSEPATMNISIGTKTIWAISNTEQDFSGIAKISDLQDRDILLEENTEDKMVLSGSATYIVAKTVNKTSVTVSRYLAKIVLDQISLDFTAIAMRTKDVVIKGAYITNCAGSKRVYGTGNTILKWYNQLGHYDEQMDYMLYCPINKPLKNLESLNDKWYFYVLPNPYSNTTISPTWSLRKSMIVIEATIDDIPCYYPAWIPTVNSNEVYEITNFKITKSGSKNPYSPVLGEDSDVSVQAKDWGKTNTASIQI